MTETAYEIVLPEITDEVWDTFSGTDLITWDYENNRPHWTQVAVDIVSYLEVRERAHIEQPTAPESDEPGTWWVKVYGKRPNCDD